MIEEEFVFVALFLSQPDTFGALGSVAIHNR